MLGLRLRSAGSRSRSVAVPDGSSQSEVELPRMSDYSALRAFNRVTHPKDGRHGKSWLLLAVCMTNPVGHAVIAFAVFNNLFLWAFDPEHPKSAKRLRPSDPIPADSPEMNARR